MAAFLIKKVHSQCLINLKFPAVILFSLFILLSWLNVAAQKGDDNVEAAEKDNIIKINLSALVFKNISVQYERRLADKLSFAINVRHIPFGKNPVSKLVEEFAGAESVDAKMFRMGGTGITPELRFYTGQAGAFNGFYLGLFYSYNNYKTDLPIKYDNPAKTGIFSGNLKTHTLGLQLGAQWKMGKHGYLDWWAIGPNYGLQNGDFIFNGALSSTEQQALVTTLDDLKNNMSFEVVKSYTVNNNGASMKTGGPWTGIRAMGFTIGFSF